MPYYISVEVNGPFDQAVEATEQALKSQGFGVVTRIDMQTTLSAKLGVSFRPYIILGACDPALAYEALQMEDKVGTMLPCNVIVQELDDGRCEVAAIDPVESMKAIPNPQLKGAAQQVRARLERVIDLIGSSKSLLD